jgi:hypothetical protein
MMSMSVSSISIVVVSQKFAEKVCVALTVMPVKTGIHKLLKSWIPGRASLPGMTTEFYCEFLGQDTSRKGI